MQCWRCLFILEAHLIYLILIFGEWVTWSQAPFGSASSHPFPGAGQALSEANSLYLLFKFSGCFSWVLICCLRDYPPSEFVFQTSSIDESHTATSYYMCEGMWLKEPCFGLLHLLCSWTGLFFVMQRRGVNSSCPVVGNYVSTAFFWGRWVRGAPPCGEPVPGSSLWSQREQKDPGKFRHGAPCEWFGFGVELPAPCPGRGLCLTVEVEWTPHPYLHPPAKILQPCFPWCACEVQHKSTCVLSSGPKSCAVLTHRAELQQLLFSTPCAVDKRAAFISLRVTKGFTALISILSSPSELKLGQVTS